MNSEQIPFAKTAITRIVMEKIPRAKRWSVSKEFKSWIDSLSKEQFEAYLDRLRLLNRTLSEQEPEGASHETGHVHPFWILSARRNQEERGACSDWRRGRCLLRFGPLAERST